MLIKKQQLEPDMEQQTCSYCHSAYLLYMQRTPYEIPGQEKYQQPQICRWYHSNGRKSRGSKQPLDDDKPRQCIEKQRHHFADKDLYSQSHDFFFFLVVKYGCESWTIKKAEHRRIDAFELWCWRRLLRVPWTASKSNQSFLKKINPEYSSEEPMLKLKL